MPPKKNIKMDLSTFLEDESFGGASSWADDDIDFNAVGQQSFNAVPSLSSINGPSPLDPAFGGRAAGGRGPRESYPIPDFPPFKARINNLPWDAVDEEVFQWISEGIQDDEAIVDIALPTDRNDSSRLAGFGFITFETQDQLKKGLSLNGTPMNGRNVYFEVAAPERADRRPRREFVELDWSATRSGASLPDREGDRSERRPRREEPELDWGATRTGATLPPREGSNRPERGDRGERRPRREEPELDWSATRTGATLPPREGSNRPERAERGERTERRPRREEPELDWGAARTGATLPPREGSDRPERAERGERTERKPRREEPELDWGATRTGAALPPRERSDRVERKPKKEEPELDWGAARSSAAQPSRSFRNNSATSRSNTTGSNAANVESAKPTTKKSAFSVLSVDDEEEDLSDKVKDLSL